MCLNSGQKKREYACARGGLTNKYNSSKAINDDDDDDDDDVRTVRARPPAHGTGKGPSKYESTRATVSVSFLRPDAGGPVKYFQMGLLRG